MGYVFKEGFKGLGRNITMTLALIITTAISLALLATGFLVTNVTSDTKDIYLERVEVMVLLDEEISAGDENCSSPACREVLTALDGKDGVDSVTYRNRAQSFERFKEMFEKTDPVLVEETSPDALPATIYVRLTDPLDPSPLDAVRDMPQVTDVVDQADDLQAATKNLDAVRNATFVVAFVQALAALFLIGNMVQIAAFHRREEVSIMRMVGASRWYTRHRLFWKQCFPRSLVALSLLADSSSARTSWWIRRYNPCMTRALSRRSPHPTCGLCGHLSPSWGLSPRA